VALEADVQETTTIPAEQGSWLDRPLIPGIKVDRWTALYVALMVLVALTRLWDLSTRSYSHDESIHAWEAWKLLTGRGYVHSPVYHGPFLYHITALIYALFGDSDVTGRLGTSLASIAIVMMPLFMIKWLGRLGVLATTLLMAVSPVMMHRARFIRHDQFAILFNLILLVAILHYLDQRRPRYLYYAAAALSLGFAGKETTFITYAIFGSFLGAMMLWQWMQSRGWRLERLMALPSFDLVVVIGTLILPFASPLVIQMLGRNPVDYSAGGVIFSLGIALVMFAIGAGIGLWWNPRRWLICAGLFWAIFFPLFTTMFTNGAGIVTGVVGQLGYWLSQHGESRGGQPWHYYLVLTVVYEFLPMLLAGGGIIAYALSWRRRDRVEPVEIVSPVSAVPFTPLMIYWLGLAIVIYSWAGEKMPWLLLHIAVPMTIVAGQALGNLFHTDWRALAERRGLWLLLLVPLEIYTLVRMASLRPSTDTTIEALSTTMMWIVAVLIGLALAWVIGTLLARLTRGDAWRMLALSLCTVLLLLTVRTAFRLTFVNGDSAAELLVYAQGAPDAGIVAREIEDMSRRLTGGLHLRVAYDNEVSWPYVWYLRNYDNAIYFGEAPTGPLDADVVLVGVSNEAATRPFLGDNYIRREHRLIWWPYQDWYMRMDPLLLLPKLRDPEARAELWQGLGDPAQWRALWDVLFYREWDRSLTDWPYVSRYAMYVRRDVTLQLWDSGAEALAALAPARPDPYLELWESRVADRAIESTGLQAGPMNAPKGIDVDAAGNLYVADSQNHRILTFDASGASLNQWGSEGAMTGQFQEPWDVAVSPDGLVYVADTWNHRIQVFTAQGDLVRSWGRFGEVTGDVAEDGVFYGPRALALDDEGNLYVADTGNKRIIKYDPQGQLLTAVGGAGTEPGEFQEPVGLAIGPDGNLYVADTWNHRIQVLTPDLRAGHPLGCHGLAERLRAQQALPGGRRRGDCVGNGP
jgi:uncharacterized protein (TIGR03663 family)